LDNNFVGTNIALPLISFYAMVFKLPWQPWAIQRKMEMTLFVEWACQASLAQSQRNTANSFTHKLCQW
jgi:hypothetical protein